MFNKMKLKVNSTMRKYQKPIFLLKHGAILLAGVQFVLTEIINPAESMK